LGVFKLSGIFAENKGFSCPKYVAIWLKLVYSIRIITIMILYNKKDNYMKDQDTHKELVDTINKNLKDENVNAIHQIIQIQTKRDLFKKELNKSTFIHNLNKFKKNLELTEDINYHIAIIEQKIKNL